MDKWDVHIYASLILHREHQHAKLPGERKKEDCAIVIAGGGGGGGGKGCHS